MKLTRVTIENLGPFHGRQILELGVSQPGNVVLLHGENMRGKTSMLNAIRWCLYGRALRTARHPKETYRLINLDALQAGDYYMTVKLEFEHDGDPYELERHVEARIRPQSDQDLDEPTKTLTKKGKRVPTEGIDRVIGNMLHERISRFFLFDGEMLDDYESLLRHPDKESGLVKESIEQILGLPALELALMDLEKQRESAQKRQLKGVNENRRNEDLVLRATAKEGALTRVEAEIAKLQQLKNDEEIRRDNLQDQRQQFIETQADRLLLDEIEEEMTSSLARQTGTQGEIKSLLHNAWWLPITSLAKIELGKAQEAATSASATKERIDSIRREKTILEESLASGSCAICDQELKGAAGRKKLSETLAELSSELISLEQEQPDFAGPLTRMKLLQPFTDTGNARALREKEAGYVALKIERRRLETRHDEIVERLKDHDRLEIKATENNYQDSLAKLQQLARDIADQENDREVLRQELDRLRKEIERLPEADPWLATEAALYEGLSNLFRKAVDRFRERLRVEVAKQASAIFRKLTTEPQYESLSINSQYGLTIVDDEGREINDRSAGAAQIVALSLIGALNRCSSREGPVIMDTPFGRLDDKHRENVLRFVPSLSSQVVLLVQSGELNRDRDLIYLDGHIGREYRIERDGSPTRSRFDRIED